MPHPLEYDILNAANATPIDDETILANLAQMKEEEVYLTIRSRSGETIGDVLFHRVGMLILKAPLEAHNKNIDEIKRQRLALFLAFIKFDDLNRLQEKEIELRACPPRDLTFLLTEAIQANASLAILELIIIAGTHCNEFGTNGRLPIHLAVEKGKIAVVALLHSHGADFSLGDTKHRNLLHNALYHRQYEVLRVLIEHYHCDTNVWNYAGNGLLHEAISYGDREQVNRLLQLGVDPTAPNGYNETPLDMAVGGTRGFDLLNFLYIPEYPPNQPNKQDIRTSRLRIADDLRAAIAEKERIDRLLQAVLHVSDGALHLVSLDIQDKDITKLIEALRQVPFLHTLNISHNIELTESGIEKLVFYLVDNSWVVNFNLMGCKISAQKIKDYQQMLHPDARLKKLLMNYSPKERMDVLLVLLENKANLAKTEEEGWYLWHFAAYYGHTSILRCLIDYQFPIQGMTAEIGNNCVHLAVQEGHMQALKVLLESGLFFLHEKNGTQQTVFELINGKSLNCLSLLLEHGADPNQIIKGTCMLDWVIDNNYSQLVPVLMKYGAAITKKALGILSQPNHPAFATLNSYRKKELDLCRSITNNQLHEAKKLIEEGVSVSCVDENGVFAFILAMNHQCWDIAALLLYTDARVMGHCRLLTAEEQNNLQQHFSAYQQRDAEAPIYFLRSRTTYYSKQNAKCHNFVDIYRDLYGNEGNYFERYTRPLLQVIEYLPDLSIVYDAEANDIKRANMLSEEGTRGSFSRDSHTIRIAGRPAETYEAVRGTMIHEICHAVCYLLWKNECESFAKGSAEEAEFETIYQIIYAEYRDKKSCGNLDTIVQEVFFYDEEKHKRELIVRVPQIIAAYGIGYAFSLKEKSIGFARLFNYFEQVVLPKAQEYIETAAKQRNGGSNQAAPEMTLLEICNKMVTHAPPRMLQEEAAVTLQTFYRLYLARRTFIHLRVAQNCCDQLINLLQGLGIPSAAEETKNKLSEQISLLVEGNLSLFSRYSKSKILAEHFENYAEKTKEPISKMI